MSHQYNYSKLCRLGPPRYISQPILEFHERSPNRGCTAWPRPPLQKEINITSLYLASLIPSKFWKCSSIVLFFVFFITKTAKSIWKSSYPLGCNHTSDYSWYFGQKQGGGIDFFRQTNCPSQDIQCVFKVFFFMFESIDRPLGGVLSIRESPGWLWGWENVTWMHKEVTTNIRNPKVRQSTTWVKLIYQKVTWVRGEVPKKKNDRIQYFCAWIL